MRRECRERFPRYRLQKKLLVSDPGLHHGTCVKHVPWCMSGSLNRGENVPRIPGAFATRDFTYLVRGPWFGAESANIIVMDTVLSRFKFNGNSAWIWTAVVNSSPASAAYMRQQTGSAFVQVMQAITWAYVDILSFEPPGTNFCEIWIEIPTFSFTKICLKMSSANVSVILYRGRWVEWDEPLDEMSGLILGLRTANERRRYFVTSLISSLAGRIPRISPACDMCLVRPSGHDSILPRYRMKLREWTPLTFWYSCLRMHYSDDIIMSAIAS